MLHWGINWEDFEVWRWVLIPTQLRSKTMPNKLPLFQRSGMLCFSIPVQWAELLKQFNHIPTILIHKARFAQTLLGYSVAESKLHVELCHVVPIFSRDIYACHLSVSSVRGQMFWLSPWLEASFTSAVNSKQLTQDLCLDFSIWSVVRGFLRCWTVSWWILKSSWWSQRVSGLGNCCAEGNTMPYVFVTQTRMDIRIMNQEVRIMDSWNHTGSSN